MRNSGSSDGNMITEHIRNGTIVPVEVTINLLKKKMIVSFRIDLEPLLEVKEQILNRWVSKK